MPFPAAGDIVRHMRKALAIVATVTVAVLGLWALAVDVTGTWNAKVDLGGQGGSPTFVFKQDGDKLTGTYTGALGDAPLHGAIKGNDISFDFEVQGNAVHYAGKLDADGKKIEGTCDYAGQAKGTFTATKAEASKDKK